MPCIVTRVKKNLPCPICGKPDWCYFLGDNAVVCMRVMSEVPKPARDGSVGYIHQLNGEMPDLQEHIEHAIDTSNMEYDRAALEDRHEVYSELLSMPETTLRQDDYKKFKEWGIDIKEVKRRCYRRLPYRGRAKISRELIKMGHDLRGVPGFYVKEEKYWSMAVGPGMIFPSISPEGRIQGLQIRLDNPREKAPKYVWFSSSNRPGGTSSGAPWHVSRPPRIKQNTVFITEGFKKADVISTQLGVITIGAAGVQSIQGIPEYVNSLGWPAVIAYDMDILKNKYVFEAFRKLISQLEVDTLVAGWPPRYKGYNTKGLDDLLAVGGYPKVVPVFHALDSLQAKIDKYKEYEKGGNINVGN